MPEDLPLVILLILVAALLLGILVGYSVSWKTSESNGSSWWNWGWRMMKGLIVLVVIAFAALIVVSVFGL